jgi:signal transduction histidine kinase
MRGPRATSRTVTERAIPSIVGALVMMSVLLYVQYDFASFVMPKLLTAWLLWMWACLAMMAVAVPALLVKRLRRGIHPRVFVLVRQLASTAFCAGIVLSDWLFMPMADPSQRMLWVLLTMWFIAMIIILMPDVQSIYAALAVVISTASFAVAYRMPNAWSLAGFLIGEGTALVAVRRVIWRAAEDSEAAHAITISERDAKTRFIASASHDLQQPIQAAAMFAESALRAPDESARTSAVAGMRASFASVQALLESMLDHMRLEAGAVRPRHEPVPLASLFAEVTAEHKAAAEAAGLQLVTAKTVLLVIGDPPLLKRALGNLIGNAVRHSGGKRVVLGARRAGNKVTIWVIDDGRGVAPADQPRLFEDYSQGSDHGLARGGFGIGLASVRRIAELLNGSARFEPGWRGGAAFAIELPRVRSAAPS